MEIEKEEFQKMTSKLQMLTIYNAVNNIEKKIDVMCGEAQKRRTINSINATVGGIVGGFIALITKWILE